MSTCVNQALPLDAVPDVIASEPAGKVAALLTVSDLDPSRAAAVLRKVADDLRREVAEGRPVKGPLVYLGRVAERHEAWLGPFAGRHGSPVVCAMFLRDRWSHFSAWLEERGIDPAPCRTWIESRLNVLRAAQAVTAAGAGVADDDGRRFLEWLRKKIAEGRIKVNQADARVHTVPEGVLLASPAVFKDYVRAHGGAWEHVQNRLLKLKLHRRAPDDTNIFHYGVIRPSGNPDKKTGEIKGIVIADSAVVFAAAAPPANPVLRRIGIGQGNPALKSPAAGDDEQMDKTKHEEIVRRVVKLGDILTHTRCSGCVEEHIYIGNDGYWLCGKPTKDTVRLGSSKYEANDISPRNVTHINRVPVEMVEGLAEIKRPNAELRGGEAVPPE